MRIAASAVNGPRLIYQYFDISDLDKKKKPPDIAEVYPECPRDKLEYWYVERGPPVSAFIFVCCFCYQLVTQSFYNTAK